VTRFSIAVATSSRADYGHLYWLLRAIEADDELELVLYVTGSHLVDEYGRTVKEIESDGFHIARQIDVVTGPDTPVSKTSSAGAALTKFGEALSEDQPDALVILGDRFEMVPIALACVLHRVPVMHIHGGELSAGALDEYFRHAITKLSTLHFAATEEYRRRILQMGEAPANTFALGAPGLDHLRRTELLTRRELEVLLGLPLDQPTAVITYHPVTTEPGQGLRHIESLLAALQAEAPLRAVFTKANLDAEGRTISEAIERFCSARPDRFKMFDNLGTDVYLSCIKQLDVVIGNSSSGLIEAPSFERPVVNIGTRQDGRTKAKNVIDVASDVGAIQEGIRLALSSNFRESLKGMENPYDPFGDGNVSARIVASIKAYLTTNRSAVKTFVDIPGGSVYG